MDSQKRHHNSQVEITDLIPELVENAIARRKQALQDNALLELSEAEATNIAGGQITLAIIKPIIPPIIIGLIAVDPKILIE
ncbi:hypothetical protein [Nostoc sp. FACHB-110]|uniref:hypothetical protein n=1 Tax=Nostoc sp. FACHB-110 TaxID=2692834 RepID=UPI001687E066|nr:hypothetical protein [Nostoc sp. FACHB-110]MBD2438060.1 hypothetical protein [Nostoc sp. FACHB-110]